MNDKKIANQDNSLLVYGIREIVEISNKIKKLDPTIELTRENIGDPVAKGWPVPSFLKETIKAEIDRVDNRSFAYTHSRGNPETREWVTKYTKQFCPSSTLQADDVLFTNGLGSAIAILYQMIDPGRRILEPSPTYPTHASLESFCAGQKPIFYRLDPDNNWEPDPNDIEEKVRVHPEIAGITIINPNNPTGSVYGRAVLEKIITIAEKYHLMIIADEIYFRMVFSGSTHIHLAELAHDRVPLIVLRGSSKDIPWPGGRCGWIEFHNTDLDKNFNDYAEAVKKRVLLEVCAGTLPQLVLPAVYGHRDFPAWNKMYTDELKVVADDIAQILGTVPELQVNKTQGAFYMMPRFVSGCLNNKQTLPINNEAVKKYIEELVADPKLSLDKRFVYYLLAHIGIVCVPASDFFSDTYGFRITTLERDPEKRKKTYRIFVEAIRTYLDSDLS